MDVAVKTYLGRHIDTVEGYISVLDASFFAAILAEQTARSITGALVEIGVHCGKSYFILNLSRQPGEKAIAIDLFEDDQLFQGRGGIDRGQRFMRNSERLKMEVRDEEIWKGSSHDISADEMKARAFPARFFSIDGGHSYADVINDLDLAASALHEDGVIAADDFSNFLWPEVGAAVCDWLRANPDFKAFAITPVKLYICRAQAWDTYRTIAQSAGEALKSGVGDIHLFGSLAWGLESPFPVRMAAAVRRRVSRLIAR